MLNEQKVRALLAPAFTDPKLGKLLLLAVAHLELREPSPSLKKEADQLWDIVESLRHENRKESK